MSLYTDENIKPEPVMDLYNIHEVENLVEENAALKQQIEQGKRDAVPEDIRKDAESWRAYKKRKDEVIAAGMGKKILRDAAAPKQEKLDEPI